MKSYWVYIFRCSDDSFYTGVTSNIQNRIEEHITGKYSGYTSKKLPVKLVYSQEFHDVKEAINAEKQIKGWNRKKKQALIDGNFNLLNQLAECKNESHYKNK